uniref:Bcl-2-like protein 1 isoform X2 n=1 Tax=Geotrypetes seraphini TaxID=260995 RepID=A0A6P8SSM9_GEOSA|nr:bcl-2-like protein 1 isoform X2 [Geotrypetes seraphini]
MSDVTKDLILDFIAYKLLQKGHSWTQLDIDGSRLEAADDVPVKNGSPSVHGASAAWLPGMAAGTIVKQTMREAADEFELRYRRAFSDLTSQLYITPDTAYQSFEQVNAFVDLYGNNAAAESRKQREKFGIWLLAGITLAGVFLLGSYLRHK